jgi:site-specific recombinase XerD
MPKLTKRVIDALVPAPDGRELFVWDDTLAGFGLRMMPTGAASYLVQYRTPEGRTRRLVIGKVGTLTPEEARRLARDRLASVASGADPSAQRHEAREAITVAELCEKYLEAARGGQVLTRFRRAKRASTVAIDEGRVSRHIVPLIGTLRADKLTRKDVQRMADAIAEGRTAGSFKTGTRGKAVVTGGAGTAARVVELMGGIWTWAEKRGFVGGQNPAHGIETARGEAKDRVLSPADLVALGKILRQQQAAQPAATAAVRLIALTGLRREEAVSLRWSEIDMGGSCLRLESSKTGRSTRPIGGPAVELLPDLRPKRKDGELEGEPPEWVFPNQAGTGSADLKRQIAGLFDKAGLKDARSHDLRRTFATLAAEEGYGDGTIGELLGHARQGVTARHYIRRPDAALIAAADRVATRIAATLDREGEAAEVVMLASAIA